MEATQKKNKYEIDMCNGTIMDKLISFALPLICLLYTSSAFVLAALTMTGVYMKGQNVESRDDGYTLDLSLIHILSGGKGQAVHFPQW